MKSIGSYVPPTYVPLEQSAATPDSVPSNEDIPTPGHTGSGPLQWSSGICACCDDMQSCCGPTVQIQFAEYREIHERSGDFRPSDQKLAVVTAPPVLTMESASKV